MGLPITFAYRSADGAELSGLNSYPGFAAWPIEDLPVPDEPFVVREGGSLSVDEIFDEGEHEVGAVRIVGALESRSAENALLRQQVINLRRRVKHPRIGPFEDSFSSWPLVSPRTGVRPCISFNPTRSFDGIAICFDCDGDFVLAQQEA